MANPVLGVILHWLGGLASGSFYVPYRAVRRWSWETYWLVGGVFSWLIAPWLGALLYVPDVINILRATPTGPLLWTYFFGLLWGIGGLTFGLTMRYLGMSLGMAVALGYCAVFGTLIPPLFHGTFAQNVLLTRSGQVVLVGVAVCVVGILIAGLAGKAKEEGMSEVEKRATVKEFNFRKGLLLATFSGIMSACFSFGLDAGGPIKTIALARGCSPIWQGLPVLIVILAGGFTTNFAWCLYLHLRNGTGYQYFARKAREASPVYALVSGSGEGSPSPAGAGEDGRLDPTPVPLLRNYSCSALAGFTWYLQFFFYSMGETQMGQYGFSSWTLHMASIIIFSSLWGLALNEWNGAGPRPRRLLFLGLGTLVLSTMIVGLGNYLGASSPH
ncbi:MAG: L-rhamnose/proton symporter RhaT [Verrucomicrobia bacterium]|nr:L-rhamnose/proton symporter RhaT [Verrucomicrobiota bacterium]